MQRLEVSGAVRPIYGSLGVKWLNNFLAGRVVGMEETRNAYEILLREPESKYLLRR